MDSDSTVIYDVDEERALLKVALEEGRELPDSRSKKLSPAAKYHHLAGRRGERGVWELHELVVVLRGERVRGNTHQRGGRFYSLIQFSCLDFPISDTDRPTALDLTAGHVWHGRN